MSTTPSLHVRWLKEAPAQLDEVIARLTAERERIRVDKSLTVEGKQGALARLRESTTQEIAAIRERANQAEASAERHAALALRPTKDTAERALQEAQEQRAWQRAKPLLEAGTPPGELIARAGAAGDVATLRALRAELPTWLEARAANTTDSDLRRPRVRQDAREQAELFFDDIDRAETPHLAMRQRQAVETRFLTGALAEVVRAKEMLATDIANGTATGASWIRAGLAENEAQKGLAAESPAGPADAMALRSA